MVRWKVVRIAVATIGILGLAFVAMFAFGFFDASPAFAEFQVSGYGGWNGSFDSDVHLRQPNGTNLNFNDVPWDGDSWGAPPYWGARGTYWLDAAPAWGLMIDYNHAKVIADQSAVVGVSGTRDGVKIGPTDRVGNTFETFEFTDGLNEMFFGGQYRWRHERWTPYAGLGVGFAFPHVEFRRAPGPPNPRTFEYEVDGVAAEGLIGLEYAFGPHISAFGEYKLSYSTNDADLDDGGSLEANVWTNHVTLGLSYRFGGSPAPAPY